jgi:uncharacterized protein (DUF1015 family)
MATIKPFAALRPRPELAARVCELPYDVMSSEEARQTASGNAHSFLRVSKPEIDLPPGIDLHDPQVYAKGRENFRRMIAEGVLARDGKPCFYFYRQIMGDHAQTGLVAAASCEDYLRGVIKKHELTRVDKEDDRVKHIETLESQTGPVFLVYPAEAAVDAVAAKVCEGRPDIDFTAPDGVRHTSWVVSDPGQISALEGAFAKIPSLYIADGHHRSAAAARVHQARGGSGSSAYFLSVIFPDNQVRILPYNRVLKDLNGLSPAQLLEKLTRVFEIREPGQATPQRREEVGFLLGGQWRTLRFRPELLAGQDAFGRLDVTLLQRQVLAPVFGIEDPRTSQRISFVGGIRGTAELEKLVNSGEYACAFSMFPTGIQELMEIADAGGIMPPKSTWFEPKLRDAMFCHMIEA